MYREHVEGYDVPESHVPAGVRAAAASIVSSEEEATRHFRRGEGFRLLGKMVS